MFIDTHTHPHDSEFFKKAEQEKILQNCANFGIEKIICIGTSVNDSLAAAKFAKHWNLISSDQGAKKTSEDAISSVQYIKKSPQNPTSSVRTRDCAKSPEIFWSFGIHPSEWRTCADQSVEDYIRVISSASAKDHLVAIGEVGLDYHYSASDREEQIHLFEQMLELATKLNLPLSFHVREAFPDFFPVIQNFPALRGVVHSFTDSKKTLRKILESTDFFIGVNGLATYSTLPTPPLERILLETDAPFLSPVPLRGKKNEPASVRFVANFLAQKFERSAAEIADITTKNAENLFKFKNT